MRTLIFISIILAVAFTLTACGGSAPEEDTFSSSQPVKCDSTMKYGCTL